MKHIVIGTAGHIDHGKTEMIRGLTGIETDRLKEEKKRGISIELGFAHFTLPSGMRAGIVDVPGHERFIRQMLAGATGIDIVVLVVAADEGVMPQTREHMDILRLLGITRGITVISKIDMVEEDWLELVQEDISDYLAGSFLDGAPVIPVSSTKKTGLDRLAEALDEIAADVPPRSDEGVFRLPIDRFFTIKGFGTVVTGTVWNGSAAVGDILEILPEKEQCRIRNAQNHNENVKTLHAGQRAAIALQGIAREQLKRGYLLTEPDKFSASYIVSARLNVLESSPYPVKNRMRIRFHHGTCEVIGRIALLDAEEIPAGGSGLVQFRLEEPVTTARLDKYVIRLYSPLVTLGGGVIIEAESPKYKRFREAVIERLEIEEVGDPLDILEARVRESGGEGLSVREIESDPLFSDQVPIDYEAMGLMTAGKRLFTRSLAGSIEERIINLVGEYHDSHRLSSGISSEELRSRLTGEIPGPLAGIVLDSLARSGKVAVTGDRAALPEFSMRFNQRENEIREEIERAFRDGGFTPPRPEEVIGRFKEERIAAGVYNALRELGVIVRITEHIVLHADSMKTVVEKTRAYLGEHGSMTVVEFKDLFGFSRKYAIPLLEYMGKNNITRRSGEGHVLAD